MKSSPSVETDLPVSRQYERDYNQHYGYPDALATCLQTTRTCDISKQQIKDSPLWIPEAAVDREYETRLYDDYGRPAYRGDRYASESAAAWTQANRDQNRADP